ncbi:hypothetical protein MHU86_1227 [Fragilaria crotonensis]|nr:hypothetical protein MHU86_1227 [Fragilaria crotonensis]
MTLVGSSSSQLSLSSSSVFEEWQDFQRARTNLDLIDALVKPKDSLLEVFLVGQSQLVTTENKTVPCLMLSLVSFAVQDKPLSKSLLLTLNPLLVNRDGSLFDNIPWSLWTVDPQLRNRDAAGNDIAPKYHLGKRDAFARFGGKDWKGRSVSIGNLALRLKYSLQQDSSAYSGDGGTILAKRILELQIRELTEDMAEVDYELAIARQNFPDDVAKWEEKRSDLLNQLQTAETTLQALENRQSTSTSALASILDRIAESTTNQNANSAPYRGAMGYAPMLDSVQDIETGILPFSSPFGLMNEILEDQCKAQVIGALLENTSLLEGTLAVGGAIIIRRMTAKTTTKIAGEEVSVNDDSVDYGNTGISGGNTVLVECSVDEAIGMALASKVPLQIERDIWNGASLTATPLPQVQSENVMDTLRRWKPDQDLALLVEGQARNQSQSQEPSPLRIPRTTTSLFDSLFEPRSSDSSQTRSPLFPTDNPVRSLDEYDSLSDSDKARTLMTLSNFDGKLPRPRVLRAGANTNESNGKGPGPLDVLLLPLIDESVRRQFLIRDAERRQDFDTVRELKDQKSRRQAVLELANEAKEVGNDDAAALWETEAEFYASLRADVTQDEGSYSRFMDQDEWYARDRLAIAKKLDRKKFGNLLDGIE